MCPNESFNLVFGMCIASACTLVVCSCFARSSKAEAYLFGLGLGVATGAFLYLLLNT